jgi:nucleotide-binding universal stress UspA family protein
MFARILVPVDFSKKNKQAIDVAVGLAAMTKARLLVLHAIEPLADTAFEEFHDIYVKLEKQAQKKMEALLRSYREEGKDVAGSIVLGGRVREILRFVAENDIELIIMSSHKIGGQPAAEDWGTISYKIAILAPCPVLLVK